MKDVMYHTAQGDELRAVTQAEIFSHAATGRPLECIPDGAPGGTRADRRREHEEVAVARCASEDLPNAGYSSEDMPEGEGAVRLARGWHHDEADFRIRDRVGIVRGGSQAGMVLLDQRLERSEEHTSELQSRPY